MDTRLKLSARGLFCLVASASILSTTNGQFVQQGTKLVGTGALGSQPNQGFAVALSADGNTAIVGGIEAGNGGAAWVYTRTNGAWSQQGAKLVGTDVGSIGLLAYLGSPVALSADGNTAIVGGASDNLEAGAAWVFTRSGSVWTQQGPKLVGSGAVGAAKQGSAVALSADGNTAIVGGSIDDPSPCNNRLGCPGGITGVDTIRAWFTRLCFLLPWRVRGHAHDPEGTGSVVSDMCRWES